MSNGKPTSGNSTSGKLANQTLVKRKPTATTADEKSTQIKEQSLRLMKGPSGWVNRALETAQNRQRRSRLQNRLINKGVEVQALAAAEATKSCKLQTQYEYDQARSRELIHHRNEVTKLQIEAQDAVVDTVTRMLEHKQDMLQALDDMNVDTELKELAKEVVTRTHMKSAQDLVDRHDE